ncbi:MAG: ABC transporter ATP-binding protein [Eggerthellaceae bacterium]
MNDAVVVKGGRPILTVPYFRLEEGESVAILGPNGSGKSTFIKLITREYLPLFRENPPVIFRGQKRPVLAEMRAALGILSSTMQNEISVHLPAIDIVAGGLFATLGLPQIIKEEDKDRARVKADAAMKILGIEDIESQDVKTLSTGQARRVLVARALIHNPEALIFDEPCTGLDPSGMYYIRESMRDLIKRGKSIVLVSHYPEDIIPEINRIVLLKDGKIFADGPKEDLLTTDIMQDLFEVPVEIRRNGETYSLVST